MVHEGVYGLPIPGIGYGVSSGFKLAKKGVKHLNNVAKREVRTFAKKQLVSNSTRSNFGDQLKLSLKLGPLKSRAIKREVAQIVRKRRIESGDPGFNITSLSDAVKFPMNMAGGKPRTFITDWESLSKVLKVTELKSGSLILSNRQWKRLTKKLGIPGQRFSMQRTGAILTEIIDAGKRNIRFPLDGNKKFKGKRQGTSGRLFEAIIDPISNSPAPGLKKKVLFPKKNSPKIKAYLKEVWDRTPEKRK